MIRSRWSAYAMLGLLVLGAACSPAPAQHGNAGFEPVVDQLQAKAASHPGDAVTLRELGVAHLRNGDYGKANEYLQLAFARDQHDPRTLFHLGLVNEAVAKTETALRLYSSYHDMETTSPYRQLMAGRYGWVLRQRQEAEVRERLAAEQAASAEGKALCVGSPEPNVVAIYALAYEGQDRRYSAFGRGLAEWLTQDLGQVHAVRTIERAQTQHLLDALSLSAEEQFNAESARRVGCLLESGRLVGGLYSLLGDTNVQVLGSYWAETGITDLTVQVAPLSSFFEVEKQLVFALIDAMGIVLSPDERRRIDVIPTQHIDAFLAYSQGLEREDAGAFKEAARFYEQAVTLDDGFSAARQRAEETAGLARVGGTVEQALTTTSRVE